MVEGRRRLKVAEHESKHFLSVSYIENIFLSYHTFKRWLESESRNSGMKLSLCNENARVSPVRQQEPSFILSRLSMVVLLRTILLG